MSLTTKLCDRCKRRIKIDAISCVCGWTSSQASRPEYSTPCCFGGCPNSARVRVFTGTGWADVCLDDYPRLERAPRVSHSPSVTVIQEAYQRRITQREANEKRQAA